MDNDVFKTLNERYPFMSVVRYADKEYVGIIQNRDNTVTTIYDYGSIIDAEIKTLFIELGNAWWWESNRSVPINIFLKAEWEPFKTILKTFSNKDCDVLHGPVCSLKDISVKRKKSRSIQLVRRVD